jgi:hypothetical protein
MTSAAVGPCVPRAVNSALDPPVSAPLHSGKRYAVTNTAFSMERKQRYMHTLRALANGLRTDHPVPDLPFVDDSHLPIDDADAFEAVGRGAGHGMWGRWDPERVSGGWRAFTTDPIRRRLAWVVRYHPEHGCSVLLVRDDDATDWHSDLHDGPLLFRAGGYWWDGAAWYRPGQIWDSADEDYIRTPVPAAHTVSADDLLPSDRDDLVVPDGDPTAGRILQLGEFDPATPPRGPWINDLAMWAAHRGYQGLEQCVVQVSAPELTGDQLVGISEMAALGGIAASTLRAYLSRGEGDVPLPQATISGRSAWSRPVAQDWAEARRRSTDSVVATLTAGDATIPPPGVKDIRERFGRIFHSTLFGRPDVRKRWAIRWRGEDDVRKVADQLAWNVAASLDDIVPTGPLAQTVRQAVIDDLAVQQHDPVDKEQFYVLASDIAKMLDWLIRHHPDHGHYTLSGIVRDAEKRLSIPRDRIAYCLRVSLTSDGKLTADQVDDYLDRALPPTKPTAKEEA